MDLWVERYRPKKLDHFVWQDKKQRNQIEQMLEQKSIPSMLLVGGPGMGKTTLGKMVLHLLNVEEADILFLNASHENSVDVMRNKITNFVQTWAFGDFKYVFLDEADFLSINSMAILRNLIETYSNSVRFILTCNYEHKIIDALKSRLQTFRFSKLENDEFIIRVAEILANENIEFNIDILDSYVRATYPDMRKCINTLQQNSINGKLVSLDQNQSNNVSDYLLNAVELFKKNKINEGRKLLVQNVRTEEIEDIYRFFYNNLDLWGESDEMQEEAILIIAKGIRNHSLCFDPEINLSSTIVELSRIKKG